MSLGFKGLTVMVIPFYRNDNNMCFRDWLMLIEMLKSKEQTVASNAQDKQESIRPKCKLGYS
jgi:hypothetical protein